jgi:hypothetical protein
MAGILGLFVPLVAGDEMTAGLELKAGLATTAGGTAIFIGVLLLSPDNALKLLITALTSFSSFSSFLSFSSFFSGVGARFEGGDDFVPKVVPADFNPKPGEATFVTFPPPKAFPDVFSFEDAETGAVVVAVAAGCDGLTGATGAVVLTAHDAFEVLGGSTFFPSTFFAKPLINEELLTSTLSTVDCTTLGFTDNICCCCFETGGGDGGFISTEQIVSSSDN